MSLVLGLPGMPAAAEDVMVGRDIRLAEATGGRLHILHVSTAGSVELDPPGQGARRARHGRGLPAPLHADRRVPAHVRLELQDEPAAAGQEHVDACIAGLRDGTIDVICTDHAPHALEKKMRELDQAPFGIVGLETAWAWSSRSLIEPGHLTGRRHSAS